MLLTFKTVDNVIFKIEVDPAEKVKSLKKRIENDRGAEYIAKGMKLLFAGKILDDEKTISDYSISDKGFVVIMVPRPKTPGKESRKTSRSNSAQIPGISTIDEDTPLAFDARFSSASPTNPVIPQWQGQERLARSGSSSDNGTSTGSLGKLFKSQNSSESGLPARSRKRDALRSSMSSQSSGQVAMMLQDGAMSPDVMAASSMTGDMPPLTSPDTHQTDVVTSPLQSLDEQTKLSEVSNWLDKIDMEEATSMVENPSNADETLIRNVQRIVEMGFEREQAEVALHASFNSVEGALEYLVTGFPPAEQNEPRLPSFAWIPPVVRQPHAAARSRRDLDDDPLEFLQTDEEFQYLRLAVQKDPDLLPSALMSFRLSHSDLEPVFEAFEDRLVELLTEQVDDSQSFARAAVAMDTAHLPTTDETPESPMSEMSQNPPAGSSLHLHMESHQALDRLDPLQSSSTDTDRLVDLPAALDDSMSSSPVLSCGEQRVPPVGEDTSGFETPHEEDDNYESFHDEEEEKLTEDLIRALLLQDQEEEERLEMERRVAAAETISSSNVESLGSGVASGVGRTSVSIGGGGGGSGGGRSLEEMGYVRVTMEEKQAIDRLKSLGFKEEHVVQVYLACERNEEMAANMLLDKD